MPSKGGEQPAGPLVGRAIVSYREIGPALALAGCAVAALTSRRLAGVEGSPIGLRVLGAARRLGGC